MFCKRVRVLDMIREFDVLIDLWVRFNGLWMYISIEGIYNIYLIVILFVYDIFGIEKWRKVNLIIV